MEKVAVTVRIPALDNTFEFVVPNNMSVRNTLKLMLRILRSEYGISASANGIMLFDMRDQNALPPDCSFAQLDICDGAKLLMI